MTRFVLLRHNCPADYRDGPHWDLMLERPGVAHEHRLATWSLLALPRPWAVALGVPEAAADGAIRATELADHRAWYLDHEGPLRSAPGAVAQLARGVCLWRIDEPDRVEAGLTDARGLEGVVDLSRQRGIEWQLSWSPQNHPPGE